MKIALCYESVLPARGGCETYIADLARRLAADKHEVHLFASQWDADLLPAEIKGHVLPRPVGPRFLKPWRFAASCERALAEAEPMVSVGFNKTTGQDVQYPLAGLHVASVEHNIQKFSSPLMRAMARLVKAVDLASWSFSLLERKQYLGANRPLVVVNSQMVGRHFQQYYGVSPDDVRVVHCASDPDRFAHADRPRRRVEWRQFWGIKPEETVGLFVAMNYRLKGLEPLLHAIKRLPTQVPFRMLVAGNARTAPWQRLAYRLGIADRVLFVGPRRDVHHCFFAADFLVHPTFYDPCSLVVLEALGCGLPVITTRFNGAAELLTPPREGYVIDNPHDHGQLAWAMEQLLDPARRKACAQAARKSAVHWSFDEHYRQLLQVFEEAEIRKQAA